MEAVPQSWPCMICLRPSVPTVHEGCEERVRENLKALPGLYRQLEAALYPGRHGGQGRGGTRTAPLPCNEDALDLRARGGIEGVLGGWARDLCERERWTIPDLGSVQATVDWAAGLLLINLTVLCDEHPAIREIADELRQVVGQARRIITGEKPPLRVPVTCSAMDCGGVMKVTLDTPGARCPKCGVQYGHAEVLQLPMAERRIAA